MENALSLALVIGPMYLMLGVSVLLYTKTYHRLLDKFEEDHLPLFGQMIVEGVLGLVSINLYNVWEWNVWLLVTLTGWALLIKSLLYFLVPGPLIKKCLAISKGMGMLYLSGLVSVVVGGLLSYYAYMV